MKKYECYCMCINEILIDMHRKKKVFLTKSEIEKYYDYYLNKYEKEILSE